MRKALIALAAFVLTGFAASAASASTVQVFQLFDHPDGNAAPPTYGLRLDNLFGSGTGTTHFSFNTAEGVFLTVSDMGGMLSINIAGRVFGGVDTGSGYDASQSGYFDLNFNYTVDVQASGTGWVVPTQSTSNNGSLVGVAGDAFSDGLSFNLFEKVLMGADFKFLQDEHRLGGHPEAGQGYWVGRGWLTTNRNGEGTGDTMDFLFIGKPVPTPAAAGLGLIGLAGVASRRRRTC